MADPQLTAAPIPILQGTLDRFGGMNIPAKNLPDNDHDFAQQIHASMEEWRTKKIRGVWITVPIALSSFISIASELGFKFHHARDQFAIINTWIPTDQLNKMPLYPFTSVGVGGLVINDKAEILVVREKYQGPGAPWKLPGGMADPKEDIGDVACREVMEETNIKAEFVSLLGFRHFHIGLFGTGDLYFIARLKPLTEEITFDKDELLDARWMPLDEFLDDPKVTDVNRWIGTLAKNHLSDPEAFEYSAKLLPTYDKKSFNYFYAIDSERDAKL